MFWKTLRLAPLSFVAFLLFAPLLWIATLLAFVFSPVIAGISMVTGKNTVGGILSYLTTHNATLDGGIDQGVIGYEPNLSGWRLWWQRTCWVCRNPAYKFAALVLGFPTEGSKVVFESGSKDKPYSYWSVIETASGARYFGYRGGGTWIGWNYRPYGSWHQFQAKPF
jgi:hypothetical protein